MNADSGQQKQPNLVGMHLGAAGTEVGGGSERPARAALVAHAKNNREQPRRVCVRVCV